LIVAVTIVPMMWMEAIRSWALAVLGDASLAARNTLGIVWAAREILWLNLERVLLAVVIAYAMQSTTGIATRLWLSRRVPERGIASG
jgi:hypothetical protein